MEIFSFPITSSIAHSEMGFPEVLHPLIAGTAAGMTSKLIEFPFDTVKVRLQTQGPVLFYKGPWDCFAKTIAEDGLCGLYKGLSAPLAAAMFENAIGFAIYGNTAPLLHQRFPDHPISNSAFAGAVSGIGLGLFLTPVELVKCKLQSKQTSHLYKGPIDCIMSMAVLQGGILRNLFRGLGATLCREIPGGAVYFGTYESSLCLLSSGKKREEIHPLAFLASGSIAGISFWTFIFPFDSAKSRIQVGGTVAVDESLFTTMKVMVREEGVMSLYRGLGITLVRALPANAILFGSYEFVNHLLKNP